MSKLQRENAHLKFKVSQQEHTIQEYKSDLELITEEASSEHNDVRIFCSCVLPYSCKYNPNLTSGHTKLYLHYAVAKLSFLFA